MYPTSFRRRVTRRAATIIPAKAGIAALALLCAALLSACQGGTDSPVPVARVAVSGAADTITVGDRRTLVAALSDAHGAALSGRTLAWASSDNSVATVDASGVLSALTPGRVTITATSEGVSGQLSVAVRRKPVAIVALDRPVDTLWLGRTHTLRAQPRDVDGGALADRTVTWSAADTSVLSVATASDGSAIVRGARLGNTNLVALSEGVSSTIPVAVIAIPVARVTLAAPDTVIVGRTAPLLASATAPDGTLLALADLAGRSVGWSSDRTGVITVAATSGFSAMAQGVGAGNATISATIDGVTARYTMLAARSPVARVTFPTSALTMRVGDATTLAADPRDASGQPAAGAPMVYTLTSGTGVVRLTAATAPNGSPAVRIDALAVGTATVAVTVDGQTATLAVTVSSTGATLSAYPSSITAGPGARGRLTAVLTDVTGQTSTPTFVAWTSSNTAVATVDATGRITTVAPGTATIRATATGGSATIPVTVTAAPASTYHIDVIPVGFVPQAVLDAAQQAAARWEHVITRSLVAETVTLRANDCDSGLPALQQTISGVAVFLNVAAIDGRGGTLAWAGPCVLRDAANGGLPLVGAMTVDASDVATLTGSSSALALDVLTHELGHVLGIGVPEVWNGTPAGTLLQGDGVDIRFVGANASAAAVRMGVTASTAEGAPVEDTGGLGTAGSHWRERVFLGELMTGWIGPAPNPLSIVTVQSLADLGYTVTETGADIVSPVSLTGGGALYSRLPNANATAVPQPLGERLRTPKFVVGRTGMRPIGAPPRR